MNMLKVSLALITSYMFFQIQIKGVLIEDHFIIVLDGPLYISLCSSAMLILDSCTLSISTTKKQWSNLEKHSDMASTLSESPLRSSSGSSNLTKLVRSALQRCIMFLESDQNCFVMAKFTNPRSARSNRSNLFGAL